MRPNINFMISKGKSLPSHFMRDCLKRNPLTLSNQLLLRLIIISHLSEYGAICMMRELKWEQFWREGGRWAIMENFGEYDLLW